MTPTNQTNVDISILEKKVEQLRQAMIAGDRKMLGDLSSPALSYGHSGGTIENQHEFIEQLATKKSVFVTIALEKQTISISGDTATVRHLLHADTNNGGVPDKISLGILMIWQKQQGEWKLLARQAYKIPTKS